ncbi:hypothetical protein ACJRPK_05725 [Aquimarina sp. 2-A2]|uniref:hypothetical protein n=1 Tax=Aquimarina sp. 2-A2 TaxID=3382644 RepID=UPI00387F2714
MKLEFIRFGLAPYRVVTGILQIFGGLVLGISWYYNFPLLASIAAGGLSLLMLLGFGVRLKIKDTFAQSTPALFFCILNIYLCYKYFELAEVMNV